MTLIFTTFMYQTLDGRHQVPGISVQNISCLFLLSSSAAGALLFILFVDRIAYKAGYLTVPGLISAANSSSCDLLSTFDVSLHLSQACLCVMSV